MYSTFVGGSNDDGATCLAIDARGVASLAGYTSSTDYPTTPGAWDTTFNGGIGPPYFSATDAFVSRIDPSLPTAQQLVYSTYLGGSGNAIVLAVATDIAGMVTVGGWTGSSNFPATAESQDTTYNGGRGGQFDSPKDAFVTRLDPALAAAQQLVYSTFLGGAGDEYVTSLWVDATGGVTLAGGTDSGNYPVTPGAWDPTHNGGSDAFVTRLDMLPFGAQRLGRSSPGCTGALSTWTTTAPRVGTQTFALACANATPRSTGVLALAGASLSTPLLVAGIEMWLDPATILLSVAVASNDRGSSYVSLPIPTHAGLTGRQLFAQWVFVGPSAPTPCPPLGVSSSAALAITIRP